MKVGQTYFDPEYGFLAMEKDFSLVANKLLGNDKLVKLLFYTQPDCQKAPNLTSDQKLSLINRQIRIVPKLDIIPECPNYVVISFDNFVPNATNTEYRDCQLSFDILCHPDHWNLGNFQLRPYRIAGEIDKMINKQKLTGIGTAQFAFANNLVLND
jgi:hypothetical protein